MSSYTRLFRHPGCTCPEGFKGPHCEFLESQEAAPASTQVEVEVKSNDGRVIVLAVALLGLVAVVGGTLLKRHFSGIEKDTGAVKEDPSSPTSDDSGMVTEETVDMQSPGTSLEHIEKDLQTVEII